MTCYGLAKCPAARCLHREFVRAYQQERERQETAAELAEPGEVELITFKRYLVATKGDGRHRPPSQREIAAWRAEQGP